METSSPLKISEYEDDVMVRLIAKTAKRQVENVTKWPRTGMDSKQVAAAFGGQPLGVSLGSDTAPPTLLAIRNIVMDRLRSTGGRPGLEGADKKPRIPMSKADWELLEEIADAAAGLANGTPERAISPAQVAAVLMHWALDVAQKDPALRDRIMKRVAHA
jgi:hypothetical protein